MATPKSMRFPPIGSGDRVAVFVDAANFDRSCRALGLRVDYKALLRFLKSTGNVVAATYYTSDPFLRKRRFLDRLARRGFTVRLKAPKHIRTDSGPRVKANVDGDIIVDLVTTAEEWDTAWLLSGDSDYIPAVAYVQGMSKRVLVLSSRHALSGDLEKVCDDVFLLEDCAKQLCG